LCARYGVSRNVIRPATGILEERGLISRQHRAGSIIRDPNPLRIPLRVYKAAARTSGVGPLTLAAREQELNGRMVLLGVQRDTARGLIAGDLEVPEGTAVFRRDRHFELDEEPIILSTSVTPAALAEQADALAGDAMITAGVYDALDRPGIRPELATWELESRMPTTPEANALGIGFEPVMAVRRITRGENGQVVEAQYQVGIGSRVRIEIENIPLG
jgi:DNA-binding GntR family transcriptional regulator